MTRTGRLAGIFLLAFIAGAAGAFAQTNSVASGVAIAACGELIGAVKAATDTPPRLSEPDVAGLFNLALPQAAAEGPPAQPQEFALLAEMSAQAGMLARAYILSGQGMGTNGALSDAQRRRAGLNFVTYLPEIVALYDFRLRVSARLAAGASQWRVDMPESAGDDPAIRAGLTAIETEVRAILASVLSLVADENIGDEWRLARMELLSQEVSDFAGFLDLKPSQELADQALAAAIRERNPQIGRLLRDFALAILR